MPKKKLREEADLLLKRFLEEIRPLRPRCVLLFGSYARGDFRGSSDIDVCVVAEGLPEGVFERRYPRGFYSTPKGHRVPSRGIHRLR